MRVPLLRAICAAWVLPSCLLVPVIPATGSGATAAESAHPYAAHVTEAAHRFGIAERWIWSVIRVESGGDPLALSRAGAIGLMQLMPHTWSALTARYGLGPDPWNVRANILGGAAYLREMIDRYGALSLAFAAYNAGPGRVDDWQWRSRPLPAETRAYVAKLLPMLGRAETVSGRISADASPQQVPHLPPPSWRTAALFAAQRARDKETGGSDSGSEDAMASGMSSAPAMELSAAPTSKMQGRPSGLFVVRPLPDSP